MGSKSIDVNTFMGLVFVNMIELNMNPKTVTDIAFVNIIKNIAKNAMGLISVNTTD